MAVISPEQKIITLINVFTVAPEKQDALATLLIDATNRAMKHLPGFISASIHKSLDRSRVINYAQWRSREDFEAMTKSKEARPHMEKAASMAKFEPILCEVVDSIAR